MPAGFDRVHSVAFANGIWTVGGFGSGDLDSITAASIDNGDTWTVVTTGDLGSSEDFKIVTMVGGSI